MDPLTLKAREKKLAVVCRIEPNVPSALKGDPIRLRQIIVNLMGNAVKFTQQGEVILKVALETKTEDSVKLHFSVSDTGIGIPRDKLPAIFESFNQADGSVTRQYGGTGLGLAISRQLVTLMKGRMWVESQKGHGSTFHFTAHFHPGIGENIPRPLAHMTEVKDVPTLTVTMNATPQNTSPKQKILLVEDNIVNQKLADQNPGKKRIPGRGGRKRPRSTYGP